MMSEPWNVHLVNTLPSVTVMWVSFLREKSPSLISAPMTSSSASADLFVLVSGLAEISMTKSLSSVIGYLRLGNRRLSA
ncbi:hypothetical protein C1J01_10315 [Nonomuraea aridisoli]|uniref:Uncharacterized protein n=1 Tax=Nonomuraea aridisoli TaxID=2070368 RepID=A0A2W2EC16_9ACTN|nr:hypothetical protein C1J01_10315 [Nonomuraea aridisoli]